MATRNRPSIDITRLSEDLVSNDSFIDKIADCISFDEEDVMKHLKPKLAQVNASIDKVAIDAANSRDLAMNSKTEITNLINGKISGMESRIDGISLDVEKSIAPAIASALTKEALLNTLKSSVGRSVLSGAKSGDTLPLPNLEPVAKEYCASTRTSDLIRRSIRTSRHMMISGPAGSGKTYPLHQELNAVKRRHITVSCADGVSYGDLVVRQELRASARGTKPSGDLGFFRLQWRTELPLFWMRSINWLPNSSKSSMRVLSPASC